MRLLSQNRLASGSCDKNILLWNLLDGKMLQVLAGHNGWVRYIFYWIVFLINRKITLFDFIYGAKLDQNLYWISSYLKQVFKFSHVEKCVIGRFNKLFIPKIKFFLQFTSCVFPNEKCLKKVSNLALFSLVKIRTSPQQFIL